METLNDMLDNLTLEQLNTSFSSLFSTYEAVEPPPYNKKENQIDNSYTNTPWRSPLENVGSVEPGVLYAMGDEFIPDALKDYQAVSDQVSTSLTEQPTTTYQSVSYDLPQSVETSTNKEQQLLIDTAMSLLNCSYKWGGKSPETGFDCSGFISYCYDKIGVKVSPGTDILFNEGTQVSLENAQPGDVICLKGSKRPDGSQGKHVRMVISNVNGNITTIEARGKDYGIQTREFTESDKKRIIKQGNYGGVRRFINTTSLNTQSTLPSTKSGKYSNRNQFIQDLNNAYQQELQARGLDPNWSKVLVALDASESGFGTSRLSSNFNYGGITLPSGGFAKYDSMLDFVKKKLNLLSNKRYNLFNTLSPNDPNRVYYYLGLKGYCTDPPPLTYASRITKVYNQISA